MKDNIPLKFESCRYVNNRSSYSENKESDKRHHFIDSTIQIGMLGMNIEMAEERLRLSEEKRYGMCVQSHELMPRLDKPPSVEASGHLSDMISKINI